MCIISNSVGNRQNDRLAGPLAQVKQIWTRLVRKIHTPAHERPQREQPHAKPITLRFRILLEQPLGDQCHCETVNSALGHLEPLCQRTDADLYIAFRKSLQKPNRHRNG